MVVAEDELLLKENLINKINNLGLDFHVIASAQTGIQGYELIQTHQPDVLITDIRMPVMDGLTLIKEVRDHYPETDCIIVSGFSDFDYAKTAIHYQVSEYLLKPVDEEDLYKALSNLQTKYRLKEDSYADIFNRDTAAKLPREIADLLHNYMSEHYSEDIKISQIADSMNYSCSYLTKVFCNEYDLSPSKFLTSIRIQKAQQMLRHNPDLTVRQIGEAVGYAEQGYFSRIFKKHTGQSPLDYRETH